MKNLLLALVFSLVAVAAHAEIKTEVVDYKQGGTALQGFVAYDSAVKGKRPVIIIVHDWMGMTDNVKNRAKDYAAKGYIAFAADIYGKDAQPKDQSAAGALAGKFKADRKLMRERAKAAYDFIKTKPYADGSKMIAMGYCFGGTVALEMGRAGYPLVGITTFHGGLATPTPQDAKNIKAKVLVLHGALDPHVNAEEVAAFQKEMNDAKVDYQFVAYSGAVHSFTIKDAGSDLKTGSAYNAVADRRSMQAFMDFLGEVAP
ncbi:MAG: dienelactone hydrolase family protein [Bdellovibrionaceae bacterium]|nr:dienelactone hydrolase family protein [Pseudobdellovibrionaceae bacterium]